MATAPILMPALRHPKWPGLSEQLAPALHNPAIVRSSRKAASASCALKAGLWVQRLRRADFLTIDDAFSPDHPRPGSTPGVSTHCPVQNCSTTRPGQGPCPGQYWVGRVGQIWIGTDSLGPCRGTPPQPARQGELAPARWKSSAGSGACRRCAAAPLRQGLIGVAGQPARQAVVAACQLPWGRKLAAAGRCRRRQRSPPTASVDSNCQAPAADSVGNAGQSTMPRPGPSSLGAR